MLKKFATAIFTSATVWLLLSYFFFPIKLAAPARVYFIETVSHMVPLKAVITIVFTLLALFIFEEKSKKKEKEKNNTVSE